MFESCRFHESVMFPRIPCRNVSVLFFSLSLVSGTKDPLGPFNQTRPDHGLCGGGAGERSAVHDKARDRRRRGEGTLLITIKPGLKLELFSFHSYLSSKVVYEYAHRGKFLVFRIRLRSRSALRQSKSPVCSSRRRGFSSVEAQGQGVARASYV